MVKMSLMIMTLLSFGLVSNGFADQKPPVAVKEKVVIYNLTFSKDSPLKEKDLDFNNKKANMQLFYNGQPIGFFNSEITTKPSVSISGLKNKNPKELILELKKIDGLKNVNCHGFAKKGTQDIELFCRKVN